MSEDTHLPAARIAQKLRDAGIRCEIVELVPTDKAVLAHDRFVSLLLLTLLTVLAWGYLLWLWADMGMGGMDMTGFRMIPSGMGLMLPAHTQWLPMEFAWVFAMWTVMMVGMMTPSAVPMFLIYARIERQTDAQGRPLTATVWFVVGYFLVWAAFSALATLMQWALERTALLDPSMATTSKVVGGLLFVAAGTYQWTRLKEVCLTQCQKPFAFVMSHGGFRRDAPRSLMLGLRHGAYCVGCCWTLMALLFVGGVMNLLWVIVLALVIFVQKIIPFGVLLGRLVGIGLVAEGVWLFSMGMS